MKNWKDYGIWILLAIAWVAILAVVAVEDAESSPWRVVRQNPWGCVKTPVQVNIVVEDVSQKPLLPTLPPPPPTYPQQAAPARQSPCGPGGCAVPQRRGLFRRW